MTQENEPTGSRPEAPAVPPTAWAQPAAPVAAAAEAAPTAPAGERASATPAEPRPRGVVALVLGVLLLLVMGLTPTPYVLRTPGPVFNAIGDVRLEEGAEPTPVITIEGAPSYDDSTGRLDVMTVNIAGTPQGMPGWVESLVAYLAPERDVLPVEVYYPPGESADQRTEQNQALMQSSQAEAIAAALRHEGHVVGTSVVVQQVNADGASAGLLQQGDRLLAVGATAIGGVDDVRDALDGNTGTPVTVTVLRDGARVDVSITPRLGALEGEPRPLLGILVGADYDYPVDVQIRLGDVGGPSAGLIFAMAIVDKLTPGDLTGGHHVAGTGTITGDGVVGPIGGVRQKLYAAEAAGAEAFLAPVDNCGEALDGGVPGDLPVYAVTTLDEALEVVGTIAAGGDTSALTTCRDVVGG